jgi:hypothetical protein
MSRRALVPLGLLSLATDPTGQYVGDSYYNTVSEKIRIYDGTNWQDAGISATDLSTAISGAALDNTDDLPQGTTNLYHTVQHVYDALDSGALQNINISYNAGAQSIDISVPTIQGTQGTQGASLQGVQGTTGTQGVQGSEGTQGSEGAQGTVGSQGTEGTQGTLGTQGAEGAQGSQGTVGAQGVQGVQGTQGVQGQEGVGTQGTLGTQGTQGVMGTSGGSTSNFNYRADTVTTDSRPGDGEIRWNNATQTSATFLYVDHLNDNAVDIDVYLGLVKQYDNIIIQAKDNSNIYITYEVTGAVTVVSNSYVKIPVTSVGDGGVGNNSFDTNDAIELILFTTGLQGPIGAQGSVGPQGTQGVQGTTGTQGVQGTQGTQGVQGTVGTQGTQGTDGTQGATGAQGALGTQGVQGTIGTQGIGGTNGTQGTQGTIGQTSAEPTVTILLYGGM